MKKFYIVDGNAYIHRAYHALPPLSTSSRVQINAVFGFVKLLLKIKENFKPGYFAVCFDYPSKNFRHNLFKEYKAHRKPIDEALINQMPIAREAVEALNIKKVEIENYEADDLIASIVKKNRENKIETVIVTGDKDIMQLVFGEEVLVWNDSKEIMFGNSEVEEKFGVSPNQIIDLFSLMGDASDNVPGVKGIGEKTAVKLIKEYGNLENILSNAESIAGKTGKLIAEGRESALLSRKLIELKNDVPIGYGLESFENKSLDIEKAAAFFKKYEFKSLFEKYCGKAFEAESGKTKDGKEKEKENSAEISEKTDFKSNREKAVFDIPKNLEASFNYEIINSTDKLKTLVSEIEACGIFSIKTILNSPNYIKPHIVGASVSIDGKSYYIPVSHNILTAQQIDFEQFKEIFSPVLASKKIKKISSSLKFERNIYKILGIDIEGLFFDVSIASYCLNTFKSHDITSLSKEYLNFETGDDSFLGRGAKKISFADSQIEQTAVYAARIAFASFALYKIFKDGIDKLPLIPPDLFIDFHSGGVLAAKEGYNLFSDIEMPILDILSDMEIAGIKTDRNFLHSFDAKISAEIKKTQKDIFEAAGMEFNINSQKQLSDIMFQKMNLPSLKKTKTGYSTDEEVLNSLSSYPFAAHLLKFRELQKIKNTYIEPILNYAALYGDRIHTTFNQTIVFTGRLSSTDPNLQNIPIKSQYGREFRKTFIADNDCIFISADYSQIDLRALAHISKDEKLIEAFKSGKDIHSATAREVFGIPKDAEVPKELRDAAKSINFGIIYGISSFGLSRQLNIPIDKAKNYIDSYLDRYEGVRKWMSDVIKQAERDGYVSTFTGRIRFIENLSSNNKMLVQAGRRVVLNTPVQGTSADIIKIAMINTAAALKEKGYKTKILLQVHDDLLFEVPKTEVSDILILIKDKMQNAVKLDVPLSVDIKSGSNWGEMTAV